MLPPELTDTIIDYLHDDRRALSKCGRVARSWVVRSRIHLWQKITVDGSYESAAELGLILHIIRDSPSIAIHIQHLELSLLESPLADDIISQLASLPSLHTLVLTSCSLRHIIPDGSPVALSTTVRSLAVSHLTFPDPLTWHYFVCAFPDLQKLTLGESMELLLRVWKFRTPTRLALQRLELGFSEVNHGICMWLDTAITSATTVRVDAALAVSFCRFFSLARGCFDATENLEFEGRGIGHEYRPGGVEHNLVLCATNARSILQTITVDVAAHDLPACISTLYSRPFFQPSMRPLELVIIFHPGDKSSKQTGEIWVDSCAQLKKFTDRGTACVRSVVFRAAHPAKWDDHLLAGVAPMLQCLPLRLEQQGEDGGINQVHLK